MRQTAGFDLSVVGEGEGGFEKISRVWAGGTALTAQRAFPSAKIHRGTSLLIGNEYGGGTVVNAERAIRAGIWSGSQETGRQHPRRALRMTTQEIPSAEDAHGHLNDLEGPEDQQ